MAENIRAKAEEWRSIVRSRVEEIRGGSSSPAHSPILGKLGIFGGSSSPQLPLVSEIKEKGLMAAVKDRVEKLRGGKPAEEAKPEVAAGPPRPEWVSPEQWGRLTAEEQRTLAEDRGVGFEASREFLKWRGVEPITPGKVQRGKIAIEGS